MKETVVFVRYVDQVSFLLEQHPDLLNHSRLISSDFYVSVALDDLGIDHEEMYQYIDISRFHELSTEADYLSDNWYQELDVFNSDEYFHIAHNDRYAWRYAFRDMLVARELFRCVIDGSVKKIVVFRHGQDGGRVSISGSPSDVPDAVWHYLAERVGLHVDVTQFAPISQEGLLRSLFSQLHLLGFARTMKRHFMACMAQFQKSASSPHLDLDLGSRNPLLFVVTFGELDRYAPICDSLGNTLGEQFLPVTTGSSKIVGKVGFLSIMEMLGSESVNCVSGKPSPDWAALSLADKYPEMFRNPYMQFQFEHFLTKRWPYLYSFTQRLHRLLSIIRPKCVIATDLPCSGQPKTLFVEAARRLGIPTLSIPHSVNLGETWGRVQADGAIMWTYDHSSTLLKEDLDNRQLFVLGVPESILFSSYPSEDDSNCEVSENAGKTILILSVAAGPELLPYFDLGAYLRTVHALVNIPEDMRGLIQVIWKCHPGFDYAALYKKLIAEYCVDEDILLCASGSLKDYVMHSDLVVLTNLTSAYLAPLLLGKPMIFLNTSGMEQRISYLVRHNGPSIVSDIDHIWPTLRQALSDSEFRASIIRDNQNILDALVPQSRLLSNEEAAKAIIQAVESFTGNPELKH